MNRSRRLRLAGAFAFLIAPGSVFAEDPGAADLAWIDKCVADRKPEQLDPTALRKYCGCMQQIVEDNEPFTVAELEHLIPRRM